MNKNINEIIVKNFHNNISYFQAQHPLIFQKLSAYENAVENGHYKERYELVFENGDFDIYDMTTQQYIYNKNPQKFVQLLTQSVNLSKNENVLIANRCDTAHNQEQEEMLAIEKLVFFGVGNATHISKIVEKFRPKSIFIIEDNLELFRLSLMCIDYELLSKESILHFSIFEDEEEFAKSASDFLEDCFYYNHYIKFLQLPGFLDEKLENLHRTIATQSHLLFSYKSILEQYTQPLKRLQEGYYFANLLKTKLPSELPLLLVAPGPSLSKHINWLQKNQNNFLIMALSATLPILEKAAIQPDIITHIDGFERSKKHFEILQSNNILNQAIALFSARTPVSILEYFDKKKLFLFENSTEYKENFGNLSAFCTGSTSYLIALALNAKEIYLLGLDLAVNQKTLLTHADNYAYNIKTHNAEDTLSFRNSLIETKGNFQKSILTTPNFLLSINAINEISLGLKKEDQTVYNLNDGAYFKAIQPCLTKQVNIKKTIDKKRLHTLLQKNFLQYASNNLTSNELNKITSKYQETQELIDFLTKEQEQKQQTKEHLIKKLIKFYNIFLELEDKTLSLILKTYAHSEYPTIFDILNTNTEINIQQIYIKVVHNLLILLLDYKKALDGFH